MRLITSFLFALCAMSMCEIVTANEIPPFTHVNKVLFDIENVKGAYSDVTPGDYIKDGQRYRDENGRSYRVYYYLNDIPFETADGRPKDFKDVKLKNGLLLSIRKLYAQADWVQTFDDLLKRQSEVWYENPGFDEFKMFKTAMQSITTAGGEDLKTGKLVRKQNPAWLNAGRLAPQYWKHPATHPTDKIVCMQDFVTTDSASNTTRCLRDAGITHVWEATGVGAGLDFSKIGICQNLTTAMFGSHNPTEDHVRKCARGIALYPNMQITDEFAEGQYGQWGNNTALWFYDELNKRANQEKKTVRFLGEYGAQSITPYRSWSREWNSPRDPLSSYFMSLLTSNIINNLETSAGSSGTVLKQYVTSGISKYKGRCIGGYYSIRDPVSVGDWITSLGWMAILHYNAEPNQDVMYFTWSKMQSNGAMIDVPQRDSGTRRPDGSIGITFPNCPPEIARIHGFLGLLFYDSIYLWDDWGTNPDDDTKFQAPGISMDALVVGTQWYSDLIPALRQAKRDVVVCDYVSDGSPFKSATQERRVSRKGQSYYNNRYFNEVATAKRGMALCIPGKKKVFVYINPYRSPVDIETVAVLYKGKVYDIGDVPGMTLAVASER